MPNNDPQPNNPLHGVTLASILEHLVDKYGWEELGAKIDIRCFNHDPSIKSSLKFLRKTDWARAKVERLYLRSVCYSKPKIVHSEENDTPDDDNAGTAVNGKSEPTDWER